MASVIIVDDDIDMLSSLTDVLNHAGHDVTGAQSGPDALTLAETLNLDLVISDVRMAGMDGIQCIERMKEGRPRLKSIVITGFASQDVPGRAMELDCSDYLFKPFTAEQLLQSVSRALAQATGVNYPPDMQQGMAAMIALETMRQRAFQGFYLGIRSGHLTAGTALLAWDRLESVELKHLELKRQLQLRKEADALMDEFLSVLEVCKKPSTLNGAERKAQGVSRVKFQGLFNHVRSGSITPDQLKTAVEVRRLQEDGELTESDGLYQLLWG